jgi:protocatechuate 4,5-dioxygenase alpha chain
MTQAFKDIPGTTLFDADQSRIGYHLNMFCMSLMKTQNREAFKADQRAYLDQWPMTQAQKQAVLDRDWNEMIRLGGNIYFTAKIAATDGLSFQQIAALMSGVSQPEYAEMMLNGGRSIQGARTVAEWAQTLSAREAAQKKDTQGG